MNKAEFLETIRLLLAEQWWQDSKGRSIKSALRKQRRCVNKLSKAIGLPKPDEAEFVRLLGVGDCNEVFVREALFGKLKTRAV